MTPAADRAEETVAEVAYSSAAPMRYQSGIRKSDLPRAVQEFGVPAAQTEQEIDSIAVGIRDFKQTGNRVVCVADPDGGFVARLDEALRRACVSRI